MIAEKKLCCGCGSCKNICPTTAIDMVEDDVGFIYPKIDVEKCINCGKCESICPVLQHSNNEDLNHEIFAAYSKNEKVRFEGSSGGMFGLMAYETISKKGKVYGAAFDSELKLKCVCATNEEELKRVFKSKYLQSDLGNAYKEIHRDLERGEEVLFCATPCQVMGLKLFLKKEYSNLITVDFLCHGVPSQCLFDKCRNLVERKKNIQIIDFQFRAKKKNGASPHYYKIRYRKNGKEFEKTKLYVDSVYYSGFQKYITLRDSCYNCHFSFSNRCSDITIGDFHGVDKYVEGINRFDGVSTVCINTPKGKKLWEKIRNQTNFYELDFERLIKNKELMCGGTLKPKKREEFIDALSKEDFEIVASKYLIDKPHVVFIKKMYYNMPGSIRKIMKKIAGI